MTPKSSEQNLKSARLAIRIQSILSSAHGDLIPRPSLPSFRKPYTFFLFLYFLYTFSAFLRTFSAFFVLSVRSYVFLCVCSLFLSPVQTCDLNLGGAERRSAEASEFLMVFRFSVAVFFTFRPAAMPHLQKSVRATPAQLRRKQFSPPAEYKTGIAKQKPFCNIIIVYMPRDGSFVVSIFYEF